MTLYIDPLVLELLIFAGVVVSVIGAVLILAWMYEAKRSSRPKI